MRRFLFRVMEVLDYRTFVVATIFAALCVTGFLVVASAQTAHDALHARDRTASAAGRRIDKLQAELAKQRDDDAAKAARMNQRIGRLQAGFDALSEQVRQSGDSPVVTASQVADPASPRPSSSPKVSPRPSPSRSPRPSASPSPTCRPLPVIGCRS